MAVRNTLKAEERLKHKKRIEDLFSNGKWFGQYPIRAVYLFSKEELPYPAQALFAVSKRNFKLAVKRNLLKRRMREAYRQNKHGLYENLSTADKHLLIAFNFQGKQEANFSDVENAIKTILDELVKKTTQLLE